MEGPPNDQPAGSGRNDALQLIERLAANYESLAPTQRTGTSTRTLNEYLFSKRLTCPAYYELVRRYTQFLVPTAQQALHHQQQQQQSSAPAPAAKGRKASKAKAAAGSPASAAPAPGAQSGAASSSAAAPPDEESTKPKKSAARKPKAAKANGKGDDNEHDVLKDLENEAIVDPAPDVRSLARLHTMSRDETEAERVVLDERTFRNRMERAAVRVSSARSPIEVKSESVHLLMHATQLYLRELLQLVADAARTRRDRVAGPRPDRRITSRPLLELAEIERAELREAELRRHRERERLREQAEQAENRKKRRGDDDAELGEYRRQRQLLHMNEAAQRELGGANVNFADRLLEPSFGSQRDLQSDAELAAAAVDATNAEMPKRIVLQDVVAVMETLPSLSKSERLARLYWQLVPAHAADDAEGGGVGGDDVEMVGAREPQP